MKTLMEVIECDMCHNVQRADKAHFVTIGGDVQYHSHEVDRRSKLTPTTKSILRVSPVKMGDAIIPLTICVSCFKDKIEDVLGSL